MFSGIIEEIGEIISIQVSEGRYFQISCSEKIINKLKLGDSVSVSGVCQTITSIGDNSFSIYSSKETLSLTNLNKLLVGNFVNLETSLSLTKLIHGHLVQGHVDNIAVIQSIEKEKNQWNLLITCKNDLLQYIVKKASISVNGVSLTVNDIYDKAFKITLIPSTYNYTIFKYAMIGDYVNLEIDIFAKYCKKFLKNLYDK